MTRHRTYYTRGGVPCEPYEADADPAPEGRLELMLDGHYEGARATDGTPIDTRKRHRDYCKARGLTVAEDFKGEWARAEEKRARLKSGDVTAYSSGKLRETLERKWYAAKKP